MKLNKLILSAAFCCASFATASAQHTQVIAHRGFWKTEGSAQNSIAALVKADSISCYGSEFDVWLTTDKQLVVNHDEKFKGVTIQQATGKVCTAIELDNGEVMPTVREYLEKGLTLNTQLVLELKPHKTPEQETEAVEQIVRLVKQLNLEPRMEYISFSRHAVKEFLRLAPQNTPVYYLSGDADPQELKVWGCAGPDYHLSVYKKHPEWIDECHRLGMKVNVWTIDKPEDMQWLIARGVDYITTNKPMLLQEILKK